MTTVVTPQFLQRDDRLSRDFHSIIRQFVMDPDERRASATLSLVAHL